MTIPMGMAKPISIGLDIPYLEKTAGDGETQLPEAIILQIQSFLDGKEIAQTSVLSKSRNVVGPADAFAEYSRRKMWRYEAIGRKMESLSLWMGGSQAAG
ncbi:F-box family protein [Striga asiatica]|uniref:F-box family protein n=1 Tax=Striga asiatica TaxID=4170 RepID=A0A5A7PRC9_STRAF|nr:F-box family protein [Striga asiatica]